MVLSTVRRLARAVASGALEWVLRRISGREARSVQRIERSPPRRPAPSPAIPEAGPLDAVANGEAGAAEVEAGEAGPAGARPGTRGSGRDARSFEQQRRGGPLTGEGPSKIHGPRHGGGGRRRGRDEGRDRDEALYPDLPILDYDELSAGEIEMRIRVLAPTELRAVLDYEAANKNRKSVVDAVARRLAA